MGKACPLTSSNWARKSGKAEKPAHCEPVSQDCEWNCEFRLAACGWQRPNCLFMERSGPAPSPKPQPAAFCLSQLFSDSTRTRGGNGHRISLITQMLIAWPAGEAGSRLLYFPEEEIVVIICLTCWKSKSKRCECENAPCMTRPNPSSSSSSSSLTLALPSAFCPLPTDHFRARLHFASVPLTSDYVMLQFWAESGKSWRARDVILAFSV